MPRANMPLHSFEGKVKPQPAQILPHVIRHPVFPLVQLSHTAILFMVKAEKVKKAPPITVLSFRWRKSASASQTANGIGLKTTLLRIVL